MAGKSDALERNVLNLLLNGIAVGGIADNAATAPLTVLYSSLHTGDPLAGTLENSDQTNLEVAYGGYSRVPTSRNPASPAWTVSTDAAGVTSAKPNAPIVFPTVASGTATATHWAIGTAASGTGQIFYGGTLTPNIPIAVPVSPSLDVTTEIRED
jgi:hypothetical protein